METIWKVNLDSQTYKLTEPFVWSAPDGHVHLLVKNSQGEVVLDPFFEYDLDSP